MVLLEGVNEAISWHPGSLTLLKRKQSTSMDESFGVNAGNFTSIMHVMCAAAALLPLMIAHFVLI